jgi:hypothetical protein
VPFVEMTLLVSDTNQCPNGIFSVNYVENAIE